jgi:predicted hotdog family 3-hydroxylacyl-ACP dehydratase
MAENLNIRDLVPHGGPMCLLDRLIEADQETAVCSLQIRPDSPFLEAQGIPAYVGLEYLAQAVAAHGGVFAARNGQPIRTGFLLGSPRLKTETAYFTPGQKLRVTVSRDFEDGEMTRYSGEIHDQADGHELLRATLSIYHPSDLDAYLARA